MNSRTVRQVIRDPKTGRLSHDCVDVGAGRADTCTACSGVVAAPRKASDAAAAALVRLRPLPLLWPDFGISSFPAHRLSAP